MERQEFIDILYRVLSQELGFGDAKIGKRWEGGTLVFKPANAELQSKEVPIETFFKKITSVREKLRVLEQHINNHPALSDADRLELQQYITRVYGSLTTFNFLFQDRSDYFVGQSSKSKDDDEEASSTDTDRLKGKSLDEIKRLTGLNKYSSRD